MPKITLYYDVVSPFAYMAYYMFRRSPAFKDVEIDYIPVQIGVVMKLTNNQPPMNIKNKDKWIDLERNRWASTYGLPVADTPPDGFPVFTVHIMRALTALRRDAPQHLLAATDAVWAEYWGPRRNAGGVDKPENLAGVLARATGDEAAARAAVEASKSDAIKEELKRASAAAVEQGAFGLPWMVCEDGTGGAAQAFWGFDHLGQVMDFLGLDRSAFGVPGGAGTAKSLL